MEEQCLPRPDETTDGMGTHALPASGHSAACSSLGPSSSNHLLPVSSPPRRSPGPHRMTQHTCGGTCGDSELRAGLEERLAANRCAFLRLWGSGARLGHQRRAARQSKSLPRPPPSLCRCRLTPHPPPSARRWLLLRSSSAGRGPRRRGLPSFRSCRASSPSRCYGERHRRWAAGGGGGPLDRARPTIGMPCPGDPGSPNWLSLRDR